MICKRCVMDNSDKEIKFNEEGICNHCIKLDTLRTRMRGKKELERIISDIKAENKDKEFDCILGVSGGVDSSYVAYLAYKFGLRAKLVHVDNGWDAKEAIKNISSIIKYTGFPIKNIKADQDGFYDLQRAYLKASVLDIEVISDHILMAALCEEVFESKAKYMLSGSNIASEGVMPKSWGYPKLDGKNIKAIYKEFGTGKLTDYKYTSYLSRAFHQKIKKDLKIVKILNYVDYNKEKAKQTMQNEFGWKDYGGKHFESVWTRFYQGYILPEKFGVDKRKAHYSALINSGQMTRKEALKRLEEPPYEKTMLQRDKKEILDRLQISDEEFKEIMAAPIRSHTDFANEMWVLKVASIKGR